MWPPPDNVFDDDAKYFVRVHGLQTGPFNTCKFYIGRGFVRSLTLLGICGLSENIFNTKTVAAHVLVCPAKTLPRTDTGRFSFLAQLLEHLAKGQAWCERRHVFVILVIVSTRFLFLALLKNDFRVKFIFALLSEQTDLHKSLFLKYIFLLHHLQLRLEIVPEFLVEKRMV
jgi:hypothetical protein